MQQELDRVIHADEWVKAMQPLLEEGFQLKIVPRGTSMIPFLAGGRDTAILQAVGNQKLRRGDIVLYRRPNGQHVLHRVHRVRGNKFSMLGDSHSRIEHFVSFEAVRAVAVKIVRKGRIIPCDHKVYRFLAEMWMFLRPLRPLIFALWRRSKRSLWARKPIA